MYCESLRIESQAFERDHSTRATATALKLHRLGTDLHTESLPSLKPRGNCHMPIALIKTCELEYSQQCHILKNCDIEHNKICRCKSWVSCAARTGVLPPPPSSATQCRHVHTCLLRHAPIALNETCHDLSRHWQQPGSHRWARQSSRNACTDELKTRRHGGNPTQDTPQRHCRGDVPGPRNLTYTDCSVLAVAGRFCEHLLDVVHQFS